MLFTIITVLAVLGVSYRLTSMRFKAKSTAAGKKAAGYFPWLWSGMKSIFKKEAFQKGQRIVSDWIKNYYPGWTKWIFLALAASFVYQAASGLLFAVFSPRGMFGVPLLVHVSSGGLFAVSLAFTLIWRARAYRLDRHEAEAFGNMARPVFKRLSKSLVRKFLFWVFVVAGLCLMVTALGSMVPLFSFNAQKTMIVIHRYCALVALLTALTFLDMAFLSQPQAQ
jgi:hypothetical protein